MQDSINFKIMYYLFKTEQEAITALNYVNQVGLTLFPPERVTPEGIISLNALTGLPDLNAVKTTSWDTVKELKRGEEVVGWYFTVPTAEAVGMALPPLEIPGDYEVIDQLEEDGKALPLLEIPGDYEVVFPFTQLLHPFPTR